MIRTHRVNNVSTLQRKLPTKQIHALGIHLCLAVVVLVSPNLSRATTCNVVTVGQPVLLKEFATAIAGREELLVSGNGPLMVVNSGAMGDRRWAIQKLSALAQEGIRVNLGSHAEPTASKTVSVPVLFRGAFAIEDSPEFGRGKISPTAIVDQAVIEFLDRTLEESFRHALKAAGVQRMHSSEFGGQFAASGRNGSSALLDVLRFKDLQFRDRDQNLVFPVFYFGDADKFLIELIESERFTEAQSVLRYLNKFFVHGIPSDHLVPERYADRRHFYLTPGFEHFGRVFLFSRATLSRLFALLPKSMDNAPIASAGVFDLFKGFAGGQNVLYVGKPPDRKAKISEN